jgi:uncharacterized protein with HEPN domain
MSKEGPRVLSYLGHMFQAIQRIKRYTGDMIEAQTTTLERSRRVKGAALFQFLSLFQFLVVAV